MGENTGIEWAHDTFNIVWGCQKVSAACTNCYAEAWAGFRKSSLKLWGPGSQRMTLSDNYWKLPLKWNRMAAKSGERRRVFSSSMADVFEDHPTVNQERERLWKLIEQTPHLDWLLLTKRPENFRRMLPWDFDSPVGLALSPRNVWLGVTAESQEMLDLRAPLLLGVNAAVRFLSCEPLLGPLSKLSFYLRCKACYGTGGLMLPGSATYTTCPECHGMPRVDWVIAGGESGSYSRRMHPEWPRQILQQCQETKTPFFFKQWGEFLPPGQRGDLDHNIQNFTADYMRVGKHKAGAYLDGVTWKELPCE